MAADRWDEYFGARRWRVAAEVTGADDQGGAMVSFVKGKFGIEGGVFHSPLSTARGQKGVVLQEIDPQSGSDIEGSRIAVGVVVLRNARKEGAVQ